jgi:aspartate racemase
MPTVGILGGMGPAATLDLMAKILAAGQGEREQEGVRMIVDCNPGVLDRNAALSGDGASPGPMLGAMARGLQAAGADFLAMACNTAHAWQADIVAAVRIPFVSMIEATCDAISERFPGARTIGLIAAQGCLDAGLYQAAASERGWRLVTPDFDRQASFMRALYRLKAGDFSEGVRIGFLECAEALATAGAEVVLAGCTEAPLMLKAGDIGPPLVDSTLALAERIVALARADPGARRDKADRL